MKPYKQLYYNVLICRTPLKNLNGQFITVKNKYPFNNLNDLFYLKYIVLKDGIQVEEDTISVDIPALQQALLTIPYRTTVKNDAEYTLLVGLCLKEDKPWAEKGYQLADEQFKLNERAPLQAIELKGKMKIKGNKVIGKDFSIEFNENGAISSYIYQGIELLAAAPEYNDFRRIDNDT